MLCSPFVAYGRVVICFSVLHTYGPAPPPRRVRPLPWCVDQAVHERADLWPEPMRFDPSRFSEALAPYTFLPFIDGLRNCLGQHLSLLESKVKSWPSYAGNTQVDVRRVEHTTPLGRISYSITTIAGFCQNPGGVIAHTAKRTALEKISRSFWTDLFFHAPGRRIYRSALLLSRKPAEKIVCPLGL